MAKMGRTEQRNEYGPAPIRYHIILTNAADIQAAKNRFPKFLIDGNILQLPDDIKKHWMHARQILGEVNQESQRIRNLGT
jgi:hypothetical protein